MNLQDAKINSLCSLKGFNELADILKIIARSKNLSFMTNDFNKGLKALLYSMMYKELCEILDLAFNNQKSIEENLLIQIIICIPAYLQKRIICSIIINEIMLQPFFFSKLIDSLMQDDQVSTAVAFFFLINFTTNAFLPDTKLFCEKVCSRKEYLMSFYEQFRKQYLKNMETIIMQDNNSEDNSVTSTIQKSSSVTSFPLVGTASQQDEDITENSLSEFDISKFIDNLEINFTQSQEGLNNNLEDKNKIYTYMDEQESSSVIDYDDIKTIITKYTKTSYVNKKNIKLENNLCNGLIQEFTKRTFDYLEYETYTAEVLNTENKIKEGFVNDLVMKILTSYNQDIERIMGFLLKIKSRITNLLCEIILEHFNKMKNFFVVYSLVRLFYQIGFHPKFFNLSKDLYLSIIEYIMENEIA